MKIAIVGGGTVGGGIVEVLRTKHDALAEMGVSFNVAAIVVRDVKKTRDYTPPPGCIITSDYGSVLSDKSIDMVVEVMGGVTAAKDVVFDAIKSGKHVVTANKALVAKHLTEIRKMLETKPGVRFGYEAAVAGGIPIINSMQHSFLGDTVTQVSGILNGTTNFILTKMVKEGASYGDVLKEAQDLGYAEAEPSADVDGYDARAKIVLLAKLAFGVELDETRVPCTGITGLTKDDFTYAKNMESTIKLLGVTRVVPGGVNCFVSPVVVSLDSTLANVWGATNVVEVKSSSLQSSLFVGQGAGRYPTANSCVSDMIAIAQNRCANPFPLRVPQESTLVSDFESRFFIRFRVKDGVGIIRRIGEVCASIDVGIHSILQIPIKDPNDVPFVITTEITTHERALAVVDTIFKESWSLSKPFLLPIM